MIRAFSAGLMTFAVLNVVMTAPAYARKNHQSVVQQNVVSFDNDGHARTAGRHAQLSPRSANQRAERVSRRHRTVRATEGAQASFNPAHTPMSGSAYAMADNGSRQAQILGGRPAARGSTAAAARRSSCSAKFGRSSISPPTGCASFRARRQRPAWPPRVRVTSWC